MFPAQQLSEMSRCGSLNFHEHLLHASHLLNAENFVTQEKKSNFKFIYPYKFNAHIKVYLFEYVKHHEEWHVDSVVELTCDMVWADASFTMEFILITFESIGK